MVFYGSLHYLVHPNKKLVCRIAGDFFLILRATIVSYNMEIVVIKRPFSFKSGEAYYRINNKAFLMSAACS